MIIDTSYFYGDLLIPQKPQPEVNAELIRFINQQEPKFLSELLGYELYTQFITGIAAVSPLQKWIDLLQGVEYTNGSGRLSKWHGLVRDSGGALSITPGAATPYSVVVGRGGFYDPIASAPGALVTTTIIPPGIAANFIFEQRSYGILRSDEYSVSGNILTLLGGLTFTAGDTYFYIGNSTFAVTFSSAVKQSPIANYVYYLWMRNKATTTAGGGETSNVPSAPASPVNKITRAWNEMIDWNRELAEYLSVNNGLYGNYTWFNSDYWWNGYQYNDRLYSYINSLGI